MKYEVDRRSDEAGEPSIEEMTEKAIKILQKNPKGYFLLVEGLSQQCYAPMKGTGSLDNGDCNWNKNPRKH